VTWVMWNLISVHLEDRCTIHRESIIGSKIIWTHPMDLFGDMGPMESRFGQFGGDAVVCARQVNGLCQMYHMLRNRLDAPDGTPS
jgi:hypothetical protein